MVGTALLVVVVVLQLGRRLKQTLAVSPVDQATAS
jgi:hypothetical protein